MGHITYICELSVGIWWVYDLSLFYDQMKNNRMIAGPWWTASFVHVYVCVFCVKHTYIYSYIFETNMLYPFKTKIRQMSQSSNFRSLMSDKALPISGARLSLMVTIIRPHISLNGIRRFPACVCMLYRRWYYFYMSAAILRQIPHVQWILVPRIRIGNVTEGIWFCIFHSALLALRVIAMRAKGFAQTLFARYALRWVCYTCWFFFCLAYVRKRWLFGCLWQSDLCSYVFDTMRLQANAYSNLTRYSRWIRSNSLSEPSMA